jgi:aminoglycoside phosphotransferase (APT) family kinase protein
MNDESVRPHDAVEAIDLPNVSAWFEHNIPGVALPLDFVLVAGGRSNLTYRVTDAGGRSYVLRRPPTGHLLATAHDMSREYRLIAAMGPAGIPVPEALGLCEDPAVNGTPFYVMDFVEGHVVRTAEDAVAIFDHGGRRRVSEHLVDTLAAIHALDPDAIGLGDLSRKDGYIARQLKRWYAQYQASREAGGPDVPNLDAVHAALVESIPEQGPASVVHGDYRLDNTMVGDDGRVVAVLDWELCTLGDALADLGQLLAYWAEPGEQSALSDSGTQAPGFFTRAEVVQRYAQVSGRDLSQLDYYLAFANWKLACILEGVYARYAAGSMGDTDFDYSSYPATIIGLGEAAIDALRRVH